MEMLHLPDYFFGDLIAIVAFGVLAILLIVLGYVVFDKLTPKLDFNELLNKGNTALGIVVAAFLLGLCYVIGQVVSAIVSG
jgi:putative membrane protein